MEGGGNEEWVYERVKECKYLAGARDVIFFALCLYGDVLKGFVCLPWVGVTHVVSCCLDHFSFFTHSSSPSWCPPQWDWDAFTWIYEMCTIKLKFVCLLGTVAGSNRGPCDLNPLCLTSVLIELWENANHWHVGECWFLSVLPLQRIHANTSVIHGSLDAFYLPSFYIIHDLTSQEMHSASSELLAQYAVLVVW